MAEVAQVASGPYRIGLVPAWGGRIASIEHKRLGSFIQPLDLSGAYDPLAWPKTGAFPLVPFHGRIENSRFQWQGGEIELAHYPGQNGHALHGPAQRRTWHIDSIQSDRATMRCDYKSDADWPWDFRTRQKLKVSPNGFFLTLEIENRSASPMPAGLGWHPYFPKARRIRHDAALIWPQRPETLFPSGEQISAHGNVAGRTTFLSDWSVATLDYDHHSIELRASPSLGHLVIHDDPLTHTCLEPASDSANAVNLPNQFALAPGQTLSGEISLFPLG